MILFDGQQKVYGLGRGYMLGEKLDPRRIGSPVFIQRRGSTR